MVRRSILSAALLGLAAASSAQSYALTDLGTLPGRPVSRGEWINDAGEVSGTAYVDPDNSWLATAFVWRGGAMVALPGLAAATQYTQGHAISESGNVVGEGDTGEFWPQALLWRGGKLVNVAPNNSANARAIFQAKDGRVVGNMTKSGSGNTASWKVLIWTEDPRKPGRFDSVALPAYPGGDPKFAYTYANAANNRLQVVGTIQSSLFGGGSAFWEADAAHTITRLLPIPGDASTYAAALNDLGVAVGTSGSRPVVWAANAAHTPSPLPLLPGDAMGGAASINNRGEVVGASYGPDGTAHLVLWRGGQPIDLQGALDASGEGYTLVGVAHLNNLGQIVGTAKKDGATRAVVLTPR